MSIRTKLLLSYIAMIVVPLVLFGISVALTASLFFRDFDRGKLSAPEGNKRFPAAAVGQWFGEREEILSGLKFVARYDPALMDDPTFVKETEDRLSEFGAGIVIAYGQETKHYSPGLDATALLNGNKGAYSVEEIDFRLKDGSEGRLLVASDGEPAQSFFRKFVPTIMLILFGALALTNGLLTYLVSRSIIKPLNALRKATENIREGNLEHPLDLGRKDEIGQLGAAFEEMRIRLKQSIGVQLQLEENRKQLLANISHDLKTPIAAIQGCVDCLRDGVADSEEKRDKYVGMIGKKTSDMDRLIEELTLFSTLDMKKLIFHWEKIDVNRYLEQTAEELRLDPRLSGIQVNYQYAGGTAPIYIHADRRKLQRALLNVVDNSLKHMDNAGGRLDIILQDGEANILITIADNGEGIPEEAMPYIFQKFYRADRSRNSGTGGSGLGLAIVKQIIEEHGGEAGVRSTGDKGTEIAFKLPKLIQDRDGGDE
ncbi:sensor histidine kinase [Cohnella endophytica]|nr:HAMP domain-containing sensor histidine kinase [Cohnella endophytica]